MTATGNDSPNGAARIAVIGDVHLRWNTVDVEFFNSSDYDLVLFVGDLAGYAHRRAMPSALAVSALRIPALFIPGNHDGVNLSQLIAEVAENTQLSDLIAGGQKKRCDELATALSPVELCGYSLHHFSHRGVEFEVIAARPHSMGGPRLSFHHHLKTHFGIDSIEESAHELCALVDKSRCANLIFLSHNGPSDMGAERHDLWGCDFRPTQGDFGDPDLRIAIDYAQQMGKNVAAVIAGHMHHKMKGGGQRRWHERREGTLYVNAARVPRIFRRDDRTFHHHLALELRGANVEAREVLVPADEPEKCQFGDPL